jgi:RNase P protein component
MEGTKNFSFPRKHRLRDAKVFRSLFSTKPCLTSPYFRIHWRENEQGFARLGLVPVKKKFLRPWYATN